MGMLPNFIARRPLVAEYDLAGIIEDSNDSDFKQGDEVFGFIPVRTYIHSHLCGGKISHSASQKPVWPRRKVLFNNTPVCLQRTSSTNRALSNLPKRLGSLLRARQRGRRSSTVDISRQAKPCLSTEAVVPWGRMRFRSPKPKELHALSRRPRGRTRILFAVWEQTSL